MGAVKLKKNKIRKSSSKYCKRSQFYSCPPEVKAMLRVNNRLKVIKSPQFIFLPPNFFRRLLESFGLILLCFFCIFKKWICKDMHGVNKWRNVIHFRRAIPHQYRSDFSFYTVASELVFALAFCHIYHAINQRFNMEPFPARIWRTSEQHTHWGVLNDELRTSMSQRACLDSSVYRTWRELIHLISHWEATFWRHRYKLRSGYIYNYMQFV